MPIFARLVGWYTDRRGDYGISDVREVRLCETPEGAVWTWSTGGSKYTGAGIKALVSGADFVGETVDLVMILADHTNGPVWQWEEWTFALIWRVPDCPGSWKLEHWCIYFGGAWVPLAKILQLMEWETGDANLDAA